MSTVLKQFPESIREKKRKMHAVTRTRNWAEHSISENTLSHLKRSEVSTRVLGLYNPVWNIIFFRRFGETCCLHIQDY